MNLNHLVQLDAQNTTGFLRAAFECYESGRVFAVVRSDVANDSRLDEAPKLGLGAETGSGWFSTPYVPNTNDTPAQIVFSSGTEGIPKAIILTHRNLGTTVARLNAVMGVTSEIREYVGVPITYSFGLGRARAVMAAGGRLYIPEKFSPVEISKMIAEGQINALSVVPSLCRVLLSAPELFAKIGNRLRWMEIGSQYMSAEDKIAICNMFPKARIVQHYGLTEASRTTFLTLSATASDSLSSVGALVDDGIDVRINDEGAICIRGEHVARQMIAGNGELVPLVDDDGWLTTKDRGEIRDGHLYFLGRLDDQINISGIKLGSEQLEQKVAESLPQVAGHMAITSLNDPARGQIALVALEQAKSDALPDVERAVAQAMELFGVKGGDAIRTVLIEALPITGSGKIQRARIREMVDTPEAPSLPIAASDRNASPRDIYVRHFPYATITPTTSFNDLGADSLSYLTVTLHLERTLGELPANWEAMSVADLEKVERRKSAMVRMDTSTVLRALAIMLVVVGHFGFIEYGGGGAFTLFFIAGISFASMTLPAIHSDASVSPLFILVVRIAVMTWLYITLNWVLTGYGSISAYFFITNWLAPDYPGGVWFVGVYIQIAACLALIFSSGRVREIFHRTPFAAAYGLACAAVAIMVVSELLVDANDLYRRLPHLLFWIYTSGMAAHHADRLVKKFAVFALFSAAWVFFSGGINVSLLPIAVLLILFVPHVKFPRLSVPIIRNVASASLMIYLTHFNFAQVTEKLGFDAPGIDSAVAIVGGTAVYMGYRRFDDALRNTLTNWLRGSRKKTSTLRNAA